MPELPEEAGSSPEPEDFTETQTNTNNVDNANLNLQKSQKEFIDLSLRFESELIKHRLALDYFGFRAFYFVFLPVTLIATLITIIGFLISGAQNEGEGEADAGGFGPIVTGESTQYWSLAVGVLGAISTLLNSISKRTNYQSQADMHKSAVKALEKMCLSVEFERDLFERKSDDTEHGVNTDGAIAGADLKSYQASFKAMLDACCDSPVPSEVEQAFNVLEQLLDLQKNTENFETRKFYFHKLWKEYSAYPFWPLKAPTFNIPDKTKVWIKEITDMKDAMGKEDV